MLDSILYEALLTSEDSLTDLPSKCHGERMLFDRISRNIDSPLFRANSAPSPIGEPMRPSSFC